MGVIALALGLYVISQRWLEARYAQGSNYCYMNDVMIQTGIEAHIGR